MKRMTVILFAALLAAPALTAKKNKEVPPAPLPSAIVNAKTLFLVNGGGSSLAYDEFYAQMKQWGKYQIVRSPDGADLIIELSYHVENGGTRVWSSPASTYDYGSGEWHTQQQTHSAQIVDPQLEMKVFDGKAKNLLWSAIDHRQLARKQKNRDKETINSADRLVGQLKTRVAIP